MKNENKLDLLLHKYHINNLDELESILKSYIPHKYNIGDEIYVLDMLDLRKTRWKVCASKIEWFKVYGKNKVAYRCKYGNFGKAYLFKEDEIFTDYQSAFNELKRKING